MRKKSTIKKYFHTYPKNVLHPTEKKNIHSTTSPYIRTLSQDDNLTEVAKASGDMDSIKDKFYNIHCMIADRTYYDAYIFLVQTIVKEKTYLQDTQPALL